MLSGFEDKDSVLRDLRIFINAWSDPKTEFYFYRDASAGNAVYPSNPELNQTSLGANNEAYISVAKKASKLDTKSFEEAVNVEKVKTRLGQIRDRIQNDNIDLSQIVEITRQQFAPDRI